MVTDRQRAALAMGPKSQARPLADRFWEKVDRSGGPLACWLWTGSRTPQGYGRVKGASGVLRASRVSLEMHLGRDLTTTEMALHSCDNPPCVNPRHLRAGDRAANVADAHARKRYQRGEQRPNSRLSPSIVRELRSARSEGLTWKAMSERFGYPIRTIRAAVVGPRWRDVA